MEQPQWYIIPTDTWNEKWILINAGLERRWSRKASHRVTEDEKVGCWARVECDQVQRQLPSVSLIITACVPAKITPFIHPRRVPALARSANSSLFSSSIHLSSILRRAMRSLPSISSSFGIVCLRNFTDASCTTACREIIICNNTCGTESLPQTELRYAPLILSVTLMRILRNKSIV